MDKYKQGNPNTKEETKPRPKGRIPMKWKSYVKKLDFSLRPIIVQTVKPKAATANHSYRDFSKVPPSPDFVAPATIDDMTFSQKVHHTLTMEEYSNTITWMPHGRAFRVLVPKTFEKEICPVYFGHSRYSSFLRDLNKYGFKHLTKGDDRNCYYHEFMLKGRFHLCDFMPRSKDARRLDADPDNEPNFNNISEIFPLDNPAIVTASTAISPPAPTHKKDKKSDRQVQKSKSSAERPDEDSKPAAAQTKARAVDGPAEESKRETAAGAALQVPHPLPSQSTSTTEGMFGQNTTAYQALQSHSPMAHTTAALQPNSTLLGMATSQAPNQAQSSSSSEVSSDLAHALVAALASSMQPSRGVTAGMSGSQAAMQGIGNASGSSSPSCLDSSALSGLLAILPSLANTLPPSPQASLPNSAQNLLSALVSSGSVYRTASPAPLWPPAPAPATSSPLQPRAGNVDWLSILPALANTNLRETENLLLLLTALLQSQNQQQQQDPSSLAAILALVLIQSTTNNQSSTQPRSG